MSTVIYRKEGHIAHISLNRPESLNALNRAIAKELEKIWIDFQADPNLRVAILSGEGRCFCAGADIKEIELGNWDISKSLLFGDDSVSPSRYEVWKPIIAAVHGYVYGGGLWLFLESDIRVAAENALFGAPEPKVNLPTVFAPVLSDYMPSSIACEILFTGESVNAQRAYELGLVSRVVLSDQLMPSATILAKKICENGPLAVWAMKKMFRRGRHEVEPILTRLIKEVATPVFNSEDTAEGTQAFIEKRKPSWKMR